jgi:hypothetical protein
MRFIACQTEFRVFQYAPKVGWSVIDSNTDLRVLLARNNMLNFTEKELYSAKSRVRELDTNEHSYCLSQAKSIIRDADVSIQRLATQIINQNYLIEGYAHGLDTWVRRLTLAFAHELGVPL